MLPAHPPESDNTEPPLQASKESVLRRLLAILLAFGIIGLGVGAYVAFVWFPKTNKKLSEQDLYRFALLYHEYNDAHQKSPSSLADLESFTPKSYFKPKSPADYSAPRTFQMIRSGRYIIIWNANIRGDSDLEKSVLGYPSDAATRGGLVLAADGAIRQMTAEEFNARPKIETVEPRQSESVP